MERADVTMIPVVGSSNVEAIGYDPKEKLLFVDFKHTGTYQYTGVTQEEYDQITAAESKGKAIPAIVKGKPYQKLS